ncbi:MAG: MBOAT family protein [Planctomycetes bacterium]|nr:MBOAT family protein [Planctomycetota bacterium]
MLFNSLEFLVFFFVVSVGYFLLPHRGRWLHLLLASCYFYMAFIPIYILILGFTIVIDYLAGILIERAQGRRRRAFLIVSLCANIGVLAVFKYLHFLNANLTLLFGALRLRYPIPDLDIILPIGLSFHTFQAMSYTIEVYRGNQKAERNFGLYALYVMFYPQLVAGPIERPQNLLHQLREEHRFDYDRVTDGLKLMMLGFFKKVVVADRLAAIVDAVYNQPVGHSSASLVVATVFFAFQIYADFAGYSDIAIGAAQVLGIRLMVNFRQPYFACNIAEFWQRWHISLSTWFRDYLYIPLGGNRLGPWRRYSNLLVVFLVSGLWHGASWTYVVWGGLNGLFLVLGVWTAGIQEQALNAVGLRAGGRGSILFHRLFTFGLACLAWVFFRARSFHDATWVLTHLFSDPGSFAHPRQLLKPGGLGVPAIDLAGAALGIAALLAIDTVCERRDMLAVVRRQPAWRRWAIYYAFGFATVFLGRFGGAQFIYFQF